MAFILLVRDGKMVVPPLPLARYQLCPGRRAKNVTSSLRSFP
jgi:hypothetical protein